MSMLYKDHLQTQHTHHQHKRYDDTLERVCSIWTETKHVEVTEEEHETGAGDEIVGEEGHPSVYVWVSDYVVKFFCQEKIRYDVIQG